MADEEADQRTKAYIYGGAILTVGIATPLLRRIPRKTGENPLFHIAFFVVATAVLLFVPDFVQHELFSPAGVLVIGTLIPIYESVIAICTPGEGDDMEWLQFWITNALFTYGTEFMDEIAHRLPSAGEHWYELEFFFLLWLVLPFTNGAGLIFNNITEPFIAPSIKKLKTMLEGWGSLIVTAVNASNLWFIWFSFVTLPEEARRFVVIAVGTVYPIIASTVAITTKSAGFDDTYWLTYWACFSLLFILMDYLENFVGSIRGFYTICLAATVYLYLPMFEGARTVFRNVIVPLSGQYENMLLHDAYLVRLDAEKKIPNKLRGTLMSKMADIFTKEKCS